MSNDDRPDSDQAMGRQSKLEPQVSSHREMMARLTEIYLWMIAGLIIAGPTFYDFLRYPNDAEGVFQSRYFEIVSAVAVSLFPVLFRVIYSRLPFEALRRRASREVWPEALLSATMSRQLERKTIPLQEATESTAIELEKPKTAMELLARHALSSERLAQNLYSRAGLYLFVGVVVAFAGLVVFFYIRPEPTKTPSSFMEQFFALAPGFGILFFIEFIAVFFLRQYRMAMDEFRHYEAIQRNREENLLLLKLVETTPRLGDVLKLVQGSRFYSGPRTLGSGETTEVIEEKKLQKDEMELISKITELISALRK